MSSTTHRSNDIVLRIRYSTAINNAKNKTLTPILENPPPEVDRRAAEIESGVGGDMDEEDEDDGDAELARAIAASIGGSGPEAVAPPPPFRPPAMSPPTHLRNLAGGGGGGRGVVGLPASSMEPSPEGGIHGMMMPPGFPPPSHLAAMMSQGGFGGGAGGMTEEQMLFEAMGRSTADARAPPAHPLSAPGEISAHFAWC